MTTQIEIGTPVQCLTGYQRKGHVVELDLAAGRARVMWTHNPDGSDMGKDKKRTWMQIKVLKAI